MAAIGQLHSPWPFVCHVHYLLYSSLSFLLGSKKKLPMITDTTALPILDDFWLSTDLWWQRQCVTQQGLLMSQGVIRQLVVSRNDSSSLTLTLTGIIM